ncbi:DUF4037 domain-containing protein [Cytobacillus sp. IB215665]|uniref:DUF4037 domain-containing protein n=1 Tax=Cytobacillus sp. IB215665 TaxID=3097357 RepID=UPI002A17D7D7|nr:DUF4037 domain-containing protein [Cytobacillus sp. IB215665]MDX8367022.1 DUF4037 domain-containing protein [Cytobacillus sp. IB215665]
MELLQIAEEMGAIYKQNPKVEAIILAGSVSRNLHDEHSDIELHILWKTPPEDKDRKKPIEQVNGRILSYYPFEEEEWSESYVINAGVKLEISNFLTTTVENIISDIVDNHEIDYVKQCLVASVNDGGSIYGHNIIASLKNRVAKYPLELAKRMISENLSFSNKWANRHALLYRQDWLMLYEVICEIQKNLYGVLFGLNNIYVHHPAFKWMNYNIKSMHLKPQNLYNRMTTILVGSPNNSVVELEKLIEEIIDLIEEQIPELDISKQKERIGYVK